ncbi:CAIB/BAIF family enzyme [Leptodontidium sp. MPI-SDFR-AT-0119]|nr:CAIB/BAIF family enzyme [Leptodontidium sp. MPI-SDFR-AT-0119]
MPISSRISIGEESRRILQDHLLGVESLDLPPQVSERGNTVHFVPDGAYPFIPSLLKFSESSSSLFALVGLFANAIAEDRYGLPPQEIFVDVYSASLFLMSCFIFQSQGKPISDPYLSDRVAHMDLGGIRNAYRGPATNMYKAQDGVFFHLHGSLNTTSVLNMLELPQYRPDLEAPGNYEKIKDVYKAAVAKHDSKWLEIETNEHWRQAGTICYTPQQFRDTPHGQTMAKEPLYNIYPVHQELAKVPWPEVDERRRPLAGFKVLDLTRVVAGPTVSSILALLGADVMRISSDTLPDTVLLYDTQIGKRDTMLNLKTAEGKQHMRELLEEADVLIDGYRPGALEKLGFGRMYVQDVANRRGKGLVHLRENCYGWKGEWAHRSGWQQISDALTGTPWIQGEYFGLDEPVIPLLPNSDYQTGIIGAIAVSQALFSRARKGGSYNVDISLTQYNLWYINLGVYDNATHENLLVINPGVVGRHDTELPQLVSQVAQASKSALGEGEGDLWDPKKRFTNVDMKWGIEGEQGICLDWRQILKFRNDQGLHTELGYDRGTCMPGTYEPKW